jgi:hypothetical protein
MRQKQYNIQIAAQVLGVSAEEVALRRSKGEHHCGRCKTWKQGECFFPDPRRRSGFSGWCRDCKSANYRKTPGVERGTCVWCGRNNRQVVPTKDGKKVCVNRCYYEATRG